MGMGRVWVWIGQAENNQGLQEVANRFLGKLHELDCRVQSTAYAVTPRAAASTIFSFCVVYSGRFSPERVLGQGDEAPAQPGE